MAIKRSKMNPILAVDIGGSKVRLGLFRLGCNGPVPIVTPVSYASRNAPDLETHVDRFLSEHHCEETIITAAFGLAGPIEKGCARLTNLPWTVSTKRLKKKYGWQRVALINDLVATAMAIPVLPSESLVLLNKGRCDSQSPLGVVAPGTGLGKAMVIVNGEQILPVASEGGHAGFAPTDNDQIRLWRYLHRRFGRVSQERVLSGKGLENIYLWLRDHEGRTPAAEVEAATNEGETSFAPIISRLALTDTDTICSDALSTFITIFGSIAGDWALSTTALGGMYLGGGIVPKILPALQSGEFMSAFHDKGRLSNMLSGIPVYAISNDLAALIGAAHHLL